MANTPEPPRSRARSRTASRSGGTRAAAPRPSPGRSPSGRAPGSREPAVTSRKQNPLLSILQVLLGITLSCSIAALCFLVLAGLVFVVYEYILK